MTNHGWLEPIVQWAIFGFLLNITFKWVMRARNRPSSQDASKLMVLPLPILIIGIAGTLFGLVVVAWLCVSPVNTGALFISLVCLIFSFSGVYLIVGYYFDRSELVEGGLYYRRILRRPAALRWCEVTDLKYSESSRWFRIQTTNGSVVRISTMMTGLQEFARIALEHIPERCIDSRAQTILRGMASGILPKNFG